MPNPTSRRRKTLLTIGELVIYAMLGALMMAADLMMNVIPNVHLGGVLIVVYTLVYRAKALFPIYVYVFLIGLYEGFGMWWTAYLYIWAVLWLVVMLLPKRMPRWLAPVVYGVACASHGFAFGLLYAPVQKITMHLTWSQTMVWVQMGFLPADVPHGIGNLIGSILIVPLVALLRRLDRQTIKAAPVIQG